MALNKLVPGARYRSGLPGSSAEIEEGANRAMGAMSSNIRTTKTVKRVVNEEIKDPKLARRLLLRLEEEHVIFDPFGTRFRRVMRETFKDRSERKATK